MSYSHLRLSAVTQGTSPDCLTDQDYATFTVETPLGLTKSLAQNRGVNIAERLGAWVLGIRQDLVSNPGSATTGYGIQSKTLSTILQNLRFQKVGIIPTVMGKIEKQHIKHLAQCLTPQ